MTRVNDSSSDNPQDLLLWEDGFWCFREEFSPQWLREHNYRIVPHGSDEWLRITAENLM